VLRRQLRRGEMEKFFKKLPPTRIGLEACGAAHHWARVLRARDTRWCCCRRNTSNLRQARQERRDRCGRDLRSDEPSTDALCAGQER
jgi:transposase